MKKFFVVLISILISAFLYAQDNFTMNMLRGQTKVENNQYESALEYFVKAKETAVEEEDIKQAEAKIAECKKVINDRKQAQIEENRRKAERARKQRQAEASVHQPSPCDTCRFEQRKFEETIAGLSISSLLFCNYSKEDELISSSYQGNLVASEVCWLVPWMVYNCNFETPKTLTLNFKFYSPTEMIVFPKKDIPVGYSYSREYEIIPGTENSISFFSWGADNPGTFEPGKYKLEVWYGGVKLYEQEFELE